MSLDLLLVKAQLGLATGGLHLELGPQVEQVVGGPGHLLGDPVEVKTPGGDGGEPGISDRGRGIPRSAIVGRRFGPQNQDFRKC